MQPSKERESSEGDPMDDVDELLDDDLADGEGESRAETGGAATAEPSAGSAGDAGRIGVSGRWFSAKAFALALVTVAVGVFVGGLIPIIGGTIGTAGGVFVAAFLLGLVVSTRRYAETGTAGAAAGAVSSVTSVLGVGFLPIGIDYLSQWGLPLVAVGGGVGLTLALLGHYFGRDLRAGLSQDIGE
ncbi:hypothetical protein EKH57_02825 [Halorubrum sp. BOL3-1]|uniref:hypothetical protein n=1 Tax=Halorubrum sp. BOL3-1 TaxID=2497325 RepID=UPI001004D978|nr:hypothetical protein [Halorubrum sp. BOL3-1]QAU11772.1 hypothetical protein EKH57_02825 [Halorubrum sp. BOL3-1]